MVWPNMPPFPQFLPAHTLLFYHSGSLELGFTTQGGLPNFVSVTPLYLTFLLVSVPRIRVFTAGSRNPGKRREPLRHRVPFHRAPAFLTRIFWSSSASRQKQATHTHKKQARWRENEPSSEEPRWQTSGPLRRRVNKYTTTDLRQQKSDGTKISGTAPTTTPGNAATN